MIDTSVDNVINPIGVIELSTPKIDWFMKGINSSENTEYLKECILKGTAIAVSDGSYFPLERVGVCAWIVASNDGSEWIQGGGIVPGEEYEQNSYRSELGGALGVAVIMNCIHLPDQPQQEKYKIKYCCDGLSALNTVNTAAAYIKSSGKSVDLISMTSELWLHSKHIVIKEHVYAHQDEKESYSSLSIESKLNCKVDQMAKDFSIKHIARNQRIVFHPSSLGLGTTKCKGQLISSKTQSTMYTMIMNAKLIEKHAKRMNLPATVLKSLVNWEVLSKSRKETTLNLKILLSKWVSGETATGSVMVKRKQRRYSNCPMCKQENETTTHILKCQSITMEQTRTELMSELKQWLLKKETQPDIIMFPCEGLESWFQSKHYVIDSNVEESIQIAFESQILIGWESLMHGFMSKKLIKCQQTHHNS